MNELKRNNYLNTKKLIFFNIVSSIFPTVLFGFSGLIKNFKNTAWFIIIILILFSILILLFYKGFNKKFNVIKYIDKNFILKILLSLYFIIVISVINISACMIIKKFFYTNNSTLFLGILNIIIALILSRSAPKTIISTSFIFFIFILGLYLFPIFSTDHRNFNYLLPFEFNLTNLSKALICLVFPLESVFMIILNNQTENGIKPKHLISSVVLILIMFLYITIDTMTLLSPNFIVNLNYSSFYRWNFLSTNIIIQNFDIVIFVILIITLLFRLSYYIKLLKITLHIKECKLQNLVLLVTLIIIFYILNLNINSLNIILDKLIYFMFFILFIIFSFFSLKSMEAGNDQNK